MLLNSRTFGPQASRIGRSDPKTVMRLVRWVLVVTLGETVGFAVSAAVGVAVTGSLGMLPSTLGSLTWTSSTAVVVGVGGLILLTSLPLAQYLVLRDHVRRAALWIPSSWMT